MKTNDNEIMLRVKLPENHSIQYKTFQFRIGILIITFLFFY